MSVVNLLPYIVFERFPECKDEFRSLYLMDKSFQTLCADYQQCSDAMRHWIESKEEIATERQREYLTLLTELEMEILQYCSDECRANLKRKNQLLRR